MGTLHNQVKQPYVSMFDAFGNQIATSMDKSSTVVTRFSYTFSDEEDDKCTIKMNTTDPTIFDKYGIGRGSRLQFHWGYLTGPNSFTATVVVRDISSNYNETEITTDLECADYLTYLKTARADDTSNSSIINYIKSQCHKKYNIEIRSGGNTIFRQIKYAPENKDYYVGISKLGGDFLPFDPIEQLIKPFGKMEKGDFSLMDYEAMKTGTWFIKEADDIRAYMESEIPIVSSNRSQAVVLQDLLKACPKGPWFVTGRGDTLLIHNRNMGKEPIRSYKYKAGTKLNIQAKTKYENFETESLSVTGMDPEEMKNYYIDSYRETLYKLRAFKEIVSDKTLTKEEMKNELRNYLEMRFKTYYRFQVSENSVGFFKTRTEDMGMIPMGFDNPWFDKGASLVGVRDNTNQYNPDPMSRNEDETFNKDTDKLVLRAKWYTVPLRSLDELKTYADNNQRALEMDKEEAKVTVEGDPSLQSQITIRLSNIQKQHAGNYYVKKCEHLLDLNGYETIMECIKVTPESIIKNTVDEVPFSEADAEKQYKTERRLFGEQISFTQRGEISNPNVSITGIPKTMENETVISLEEILSEGNEDEQLEKIINLSKNAYSLNITTIKGEDS